MPYLNIDKDKDLHIYFQDQGVGRPVVLIHPWPLSRRVWEYQVQALCEASYRVITYDRRGFGRSDHPYDGYDYDTLASDLHQLLLHLDLKDVCLMGYSMGGGEVVRYLSNYGDERISSAVLLSSIIPLIVQKEDNPVGAPAEALAEIMQTIKNERISFIPDLQKNFFNFDELEGERVSRAAYQYFIRIASEASQRATLMTAQSWAGADFREEMKNVTVPCLILHGNSDRMVPIESSSMKAAASISDNEFHIIKSAPHGLAWTHRKEVNEILINFLDD